MVETRPIAVPVPQDATSWFGGADGGRSRAPQACSWPWKHWGGARGPRHPGTASAPCPPSPTRRAKGGLSRGNWDHRGRMHARTRIAASTRPSNPGPQVEARGRALACAPLRPARDARGRLQILAAETRAAVAAMPRPAPPWDRNVGARDVGGGSSCALGCGSLSVVLRTERRQKKRAEEPTRMASTCASAVLGTPCSFKPPPPALSPQPPAARSISRVGSGKQVIKQCRRVFPLSAHTHGMRAKRKLRRLGRTDKTCSQIRVCGLGCGVLGQELDSVDTTCTYTHTHTHTHTHTQCAYMFIHRE